MRKKLYKKYILKEKVVNKSRMGSIAEKFAENGREVLIDVQPVTSTIMLEKYGIKANEMKVGYTEDMDIKEGDGLCIEVDGECEPDYRITGVMKWSRHSVIELEKR